MKQCTKCGIIYDNDNYNMCGNCGNPLINVQTNNPQMEYMNQGYTDHGYTNQGYTNQGYVSQGYTDPRNINQDYQSQNMRVGEPQPWMQQPANTTMDNNKSNKQPKKKNMKRTIVIICSLLLLAIGGVAAFLIIKGAKPKAEFYNDNIPNELIQYELDGETYTSELIEIKILNEEKEDGIVETECEIVLSDDLMDRTLYYTFTCERDDGKWKITDFSKDEEDDITVKEGLAKLIVDDYKFENLSNYVLESDYDDSEFSFAYDVDDAYEILDVKGTVVFNVELISDDSDKIEYYYDVYLDEELEVEWSLAGSYIDDVEDDETTFGFRIAQDGDYAQLELYTKEYGEETGDASISEASSMDGKGDFVCELNYKSIKAEYVIRFTKDGEVSGIVTGNDGNEIQENMIMGEYTIEEPVVEPDNQLAGATDEDIAETIPSVAYPDASGDEIYVYSWNAEVGERIDDTFRTRYPELSDMVVFVNLNQLGTSEDYANQIVDAMYGNQVPSIVAYDGDVVDNFSTQGIFVPVSNVGITDDMYHNAYDYTKQLGTFDNELMALSWQSAPGCFTYDADVAYSVLGVSTPEEVNALISTWDGFLATARTLKDAGYYIVPSIEDITVGAGEEVPQYVIDEVIKNGYAGNYMQWGLEWQSYPEDVFGYFGCTWFVHWTLSIMETTPQRNIAACEGPRAYCWGGTYLGVTEGCTNPELAALVLYTLCCDDEAMYDMYAAGQYDYPNNKKAVRDLIADDNGGIDYMNNQNLLQLWDNMARKINFSN